MMQTKSVFGFFPLEQLRKIYVFLSRLNMAKSRLLQKEVEMNRIQIWQLALFHISCYLRGQWDDRGAMSRHFNLTYSLTARPGLSV